jgi:hypothetical protein
VVVVVVVAGGVVVVVVVVFSGVVVVLAVVVVVAGGVVVVEGAPPLMARYAPATAIMRTTITIEITSEVEMALFEPIFTAFLNPFIFYFL